MSVWSMIEIQLSIIARHYDSDDNDDVDDDDNDT